jgi:hypothetical protein
MCRGKKVSWKRDVTFWKLASREGSCIVNIHKELHNGGVMLASPTVLSTFGFVTKTPTTLPQKKL